MVHVVVVACEIPVRGVGAEHELHRARRDDSPAGIAIDHDAGHARGIVQFTCKPILGVERGGCDHQCD